MLDAADLATSTPEASPASVVSPDGKRARSKWGQPASGKSDPLKLVPVGTGVLSLAGTYNASFGSSPASLGATLVMRRSGVPPDMPDMAEDDVETEEILLPAVHPACMGLVEFGADEPNPEFNPAVMNPVCFRHRPESEAETVEGREDDEYASMLCSMREVLNLPALAVGDSDGEGGEADITVIEASSPSPEHGGGDDDGAASGDSFFEEDGCDEDKDDDDTEDELDEGRVRLSVTPSPSPAADEGEDDETAADLYDTMRKLLANSTPEKRHKILQAAPNTVRAVGRPLVHCPSSGPLATGVSGSRSCGGCPVACNQPYCRLSFVGCPCWGAYTGRQVAVEIGTGRRPPTHRHVGQVAQGGGRARGYSLPRAGGDPRAARGSPRPRRLCAGIQNDRGVARGESA